MEAMSHRALMLAGSQRRIALERIVICGPHVRGCMRMWVPNRRQSSMPHHSRSVPGVTVVHDERSAQRALEELHRLQDRAHAWDTEATEVGGISRHDWNSPVTHGRVLCATCFCGDDADFGNGPRLFIDNAGPAEGVLRTFFMKYFEDKRTRKVFHNYSFDRHLLKKAGLRVHGFHADTLHMARFFDTSLASWEGKLQRHDHLADERLNARLASAASASSSRHAKICSVTLGEKTLEPKSWSSGASMLHTSVLENHEPVAGPNGYGLKDLGNFFGLADKRQKTFTELFGSHASAAEDAHTSAEHWEQWVEYATDDAVLTHRLFKHLHEELANRPWHSEVHRRNITEVLRDKRVARDLLKKRKGSRSTAAQDTTGQNMWDLFSMYMRDFGECLADLEEIGIGVDRDYLGRIEQQASQDVCQHHNEMVRSLGEARGPQGENLVSDAQMINIRSSVQMQTLLFGGTGVNQVTGEKVAEKRTFTAPRQDDESDTASRRPSTFEVKGLGLSPEQKRKSFTATGMPSVSGKVLKGLAGNSTRPGHAADKQLQAKGVAPEQAGMISHALREIGEYSKAKALLGGFAKPLLEYGKHTGRIHPQWKFDTSTGRLACKRPNLQNLPSVANDRYCLRGAFQAGPGNVLVVADYSQLEMRVLAHLAQSTTMLAKLSKGGDYHSEVTAEMFAHVAAAVARREVAIHGGEGLPTIKEKFKVERNQAKAVNFGIIYGMEASTLGEDLGITTPEAEKLVEAWYSSKPEVKRWKREAIQESVQKGRALSLLGRWRTLPLIDNPLYRRRSERAAVNFRIQGSAADVVISAMLRVWRHPKLMEMGFRLVLQVHDELVLEGPQQFAEEAADLVRQLMMNPFADHKPSFQFLAPLTADVSIGHSFSKTEPVP